jgi:uncharacterized protein with HEPN domain
LKDDRLYLRHILDAIDSVLEYTSSGHDAFVGSALHRDAVIRQLGIIGEASKRVSDDTRNTFADVPWKRMAGMRDKLIHDYVGVDIEIVWTVAHVELPALRERLRAVLKQLTAPCP